MLTPRDRASNLSTAGIGLEPTRVPTPTAVSRRHVDTQELQMNVQSKRYFADERQLHNQSSGSAKMQIIPVFESQSCSKRPVGMARVAGYLPKHHKLVKVFRLTIPGQKVRKLWTCDERVFVPLPGDE